MIIVKLLRVYCSSLNQVTFPVCSFQVFKFIDPYALTFPLQISTIPKSSASRQILRSQILSYPGPHVFRIFLLQIPTSPRNSRFSPESIMYKCIRKQLPKDSACRKYSGYVFRSLTFQISSSRLLTSKSPVSKSSSIQSSYVFVWSSGP